jgi:hypothetical protein
MKKIIVLFFVASLFLIGFNSCEQQEEKPGIPGMGDTPGELEIAEPFVAPEGIAIDLESQEEANLENVFSTEANLKSINKKYCGCLGCGGSKLNGKLKIWIRVKLNIQNISDKKKCFKIPAATIFKVSNPLAQNGITISPIKICVERRSKCQKSLWLMCLNKGKDGSSLKVTYKIVGVTASKPILGLVRCIKHKKVNIEYYLKFVPKAKLKAVAEDDYLETYADIADNIQNAIWQITNDGESLTEEQFSYFESLPDIEEE